MRTAFRAVLPTATPTAVCPAHLRYAPRAFYAHAPFAFDVPRASCLYGLRAAFMPGRKAHRRLLHALPTRLDYAPRTRAHAHFCPDHLPQFTAPPSFERAATHRARPTRPVLRAADHPVAACCFICPFCFPHPSSTTLYPFVTRLAAPARDGYPGCAVRLPRGAQFPFCIPAAAAAITAHACPSSVPFPVPPPSSVDRSLPFLVDRSFVRSSSCRTQVPCPCRRITAPRMPSYAFC